MLVTSKIILGELQRRSMDLVDKKKQFELPQLPFFDIEDDPTETLRYYLHSFSVVTFIKDLRQLWNVIRYTRQGI